MSFDHSILAHLPTLDQLQQLAHQHAALAIATLWLARESAPPAIRTGLAVLPGAVDRGLKLLSRFETGRAVLREVKPAIKAALKGIEFEVDEEIPEPAAPPAPGAPPAQ